MEVARTNPFENTTKIPPLTPEISYQGKFHEEYEVLLQSNNQTATNAATKRGSEYIQTYFSVAQKLIEDCPSVDSKAGKRLINYLQCYFSVASNRFVLEGRFHSSRETACPISLEAPIPLAFHVDAINSVRIRIQAFIQRGDVTMVSEPTSIYWSEVLYYLARRDIVLMRPGILSEPYPVKFKPHHQVPVQLHLGDSETELMEEVFSSVDDVRNNTDGAKGKLAHMVSRIEEICTDTISRKGIKFRFGFEVSDGRYMSAPDPPSSWPDPERHTTLYRESQWNPRPSPYSNERNMPSGKYMRQHDPRYDTHNGTGSVRLPSVTEILDGFDNKQGLHLVRATASPSASTPFGPSTCRETTLDPVPTQGMKSIVKVFDSTRGKFFEVTNLTVICCHLCTLQKPSFYLLESYYYCDDCREDALTDLGLRCQNMYCRIRHRVGDLWHMVDQSVVCSLCYNHFKIHKSLPQQAQCEALKSSVNWWWFSSDLGCYSCHVAIALKWIIVNGRQARTCERCFKLWQRFRAFPTMTINEKGTASKKREHE